MTETSRTARTFAESQGSASDVLLLSAADVRGLLPEDELLSALSTAFVELSRGHASAPAPAIAETATGGIFEALPAVAVGAVAAKLITIFHGNEARGVPSHQGLVVLFDHDDGRPLCVLDARDLTARRTAATTAIATHQLAPLGSSVLAIIGAGVQGQAHLAALDSVRHFDEIRIASRSVEAAERLANTHSRARAVRDVETAVRGADVICCCTSASSPILDFAWLKPGAHVNSVGFADGPEIDATTIQRARLFVESRERSLLPPPAGAHELVGVAPDEVTELGELISGTRGGRPVADEITVFKSTGNAVEDAAAASVAYANARRTGAGTHWAL